ncbi:hypothetical protein RclHR1_00820003 [Rhizophagus clarus]|uniref:Uncharacterized protein n=1 Tax=Rhizophagus clarus TaxID=94130 RepID=A0A2Z6S056_9GLOM|nr:hypothetical protein RclHR1_00820003 [Rhizophagus clarus]GES85664.1 hypothetical protein GLOIN_2v1782802 [Rhizophagus clarus]
MSSIVSANFVDKEDIIIYEEDPNATELDDARLSSSDDVGEIYYTTKQMTVKTIIHPLTPIEYPPTIEEGVAVVYHVEEWNNMKKLLQI